MQIQGLSRESMRTGMQDETGLKKCGIAFMSIFQLTFAITIASFYMSWWVN